MFQLVDSIENGELEFEEFAAMIELMMIGTRQNPSPGGPGQPPSHAEFVLPQ